MFKAKGNSRMTETGSGAVTNKVREAPLSTRRVLLPSGQGGTGTGSETAGCISSHPTQTAGRPAFIPRVTENESQAGFALSAVTFQKPPFGRRQGNDRARHGEARPGLVTRVDNLTSSPLILTGKGRTAHPNLFFSGNPSPQT